MGQRDQEHQEAARVRQGEEVGASEDEVRQKVENWVEGGVGSRLNLIYQEEDELVAKPIKPPVVVEPQLVEEPVTQAVVEQPSEPLEVPIIPAGQEGWVTVALAVVGVAGGGALWKYLTKKADQKHEVEMKRVEVAQVQAQTCSVCEQSHKVIEARIDVLGSKLDQFSANLSGIGLDDLDERLTSLEKALKKRTK